MQIEVMIKQKNFEEAVARKNFTYADLAGQLGINRIYLSNIKNSKLPGFRPSAKLRQKMLDILGVQFDEIFEIVDTTKKGRKKHKR